MASRKYKSRRCKGGRGRRSKSEKKTKKGSHKWHQKGCQSGGGSLTGGWPWGASDVHANTGGGASASASGVPMSINGNHYALNTSSGGMAPPQSSNHLVEKGLFGGRRRKSSSRVRGRTRGTRRHRKFIGEQRGGMAALMPETINATLRETVGVPSYVANTLQGASTAYRMPDPTQQPIGQPIQLQ